MNCFIDENHSIHQIIVSSTAHGIPNILRTRRLFHKIMWIISTLASVGVCIWFILSSISDYLQYSVVTTIESVYEQPAMYPTVSLCSDDINLFRKNNLSSLIIKCTFNYDESCKKNLNNYFSAFEDSDYGLCYRFNSGKNMTGGSIPFLNSTIGGMDDSLILTINSTKGFILWIHNASTPPKRMSKNNHNGEIKFASSGAITHLIVERVFEDKLGEPFNSCLINASDFDFNKTLIDYINSKNEVYAQVNCLELCFDLDYITTNPCNCTGVSIGDVWEQCYINRSQSYAQQCTMGYKTTFYSKKVLDKCSNYCPLECNTHSFTVSVNTIFVPNFSYADIFVYYRTLKYTLITQQPQTTLSNLISNLGGILGLFIGVSFLSFIEILEAITEAFFLLFESKKSRVKTFQN